MKSISKRNFERLLHDNGYRVIRKHGDHKIYSNGDHTISINIENPNRAVMNRLIKQYSLQSV